MSIKFPFHIFLFSSLFSSFLFCNDLPFHRGVNLTSWFESSNARQIHFTKYTKRDFQNIKSLGCDVIRLPIRLHPMTSGTPDFTIDPLLLTMLDSAVDWAEELEMHIILDNHSFDPALNTDPNVWKVLVPVWKQMAEHFKERSALVFYEILNEPHGINDAVWNTIQKMVIDSIRSVDTKHTIIIGPAGWNSYNNLNAMPVYADTNLIYTFHFYDPFIFTHQGTSWAGPSLVPLAGVPFPYDAARMPAFPPELAGTFIENDFNNYHLYGTVAKIRQTLDIAVNFMKNRNVKLFCGEFGVYKPNSVNEDRVRWYDAVRNYLEQNGIAWTSWDYQGGFGLFTSGTVELFDHHLNIPLLSALGLNVPPQSPFTIRPDSSQLDLYLDHVGPGIFLTNGGDLDLFSSGQFNGSYCLRWANAALYQQIGFDFGPDKDLSVLKNKNYRLFLRIKKPVSGTSFDVRFVDTKTGPSDHPWRMRTTISDLPVPFSGDWQTFSIRLADMVEHGSWDSVWYNPIGAFDWKAVDRFEIVAEQASLTGKELWFDDIRIVSPPAYAGGTPTQIPNEYQLLQNFPNPFNPSTTIQFAVPRRSLVTVRIYSVLGQLVATLVNGEIEAGTHQRQWTPDISGGVYLCRMESGSFTQTQKLIVLK